MGLTDPERRALMGGAAPPADPAVARVIVEPIGVHLADATTLSSVSRSGLYRAAARGEVIFWKYGDRIIVDYASLKAMVQRLPRAVINVAV